MKTEKAYYVGTKPLSFNGGKPAEILGVVIKTVGNEKPFPHFHLRGDYGVEGFEPVCLDWDYQIVTAEAAAEKIKKATEGRT